MAKKKSSPKKRKPLSSEEIQALVRECYGNNIASYIKTPIKDKAFIGSVARIGKSFTSGTRSIPVKIATDFIYDLGGETINDSTIAAAIDITKSEELCNFLSKHLHYKSTRDNTFAGLIIRRYLDPVMSKKVGAPTFAFNSFILIHNHEIKLKHDQRNDYSLHVLDKLGLSTIYHKVFREKGIKKTDSGGVLDSLVPAKHERFTGMYEKALVRFENKWTWAHLKESGRMIRAEEKILGRIYSAKEHIVVSSDVEKEAEEYKKLPISTVVSDASKKTWTTDGKIGYVGVYGIGIEEGGDDTGELLYGPPNSTGAAACSGYQDIGSCKACCTAYQVAGLTGVVGGAMKCHGSTCWWCPPCHIVCGVVETIAAALIIYYFEKCKDNCDKEYWNEY